MPLQKLPPFFNMKYTEDDGMLAPDGLLFNDQTWQVLNQIVNYFNDGLPMPQARTAVIAAYGADTTVAIGTVWFNTDLAKLQVKTANATIETITST